MRLLRIASLCAALCVVAPLSAREPVEPPCDPPVPALHLPDVAAPGGAESALLKIFAADQADREFQIGADRKPKLSPLDPARRMRSVLRRMCRRPRGRSSELSAARMKRRASTA